MKSQLSLTILKVIGLILIGLFIYICNSTAQTLTALFSSVILSAPILLNGKEINLYYDEYNAQYKVIKDEGRKELTDMLSCDTIGLIQDEYYYKLEQEMKESKMKISRIY